MKRWHDLTIAERAAVTDDEFRLHCDYWLMENGYVRPVAPVLLDENPPAPSTRTVYVIEKRGEFYGAGLGIAFESESDAAAMIALKPLLVDHDYSSDITRTKDVPLTVTPREITTEQEFLNVKEAAAEAKSIKDANTKARKEFEKASRTIDNVLEFMRDERREAESKVYEIGRVKTTFAEYVTMCNGDEQAARRFLVKSFGIELVNEAIGIDDQIAFEVGADAQAETDERSAETL